MPVELTTKRLAELRQYIEAGNYLQPSDALPLLDSLEAAEARADRQVHEVKALKTLLKSAEAQAAANDFRASPAFIALERKLEAAELDVAVMRDGSGVIEVQRDRISELERRLEAAEKVIEAVDDLDTTRLEWFPDGWSRLEAALAEYRRDLEARVKELEKEMRRSLRWDLYQRDQSWEVVDRNGVCGHPVEGGVYCCREKNHAGRHG